MVVQNKIEKFTKQLILTNAYRAHHNRITVARKLELKQQPKDKQKPTLLRHIFKKSYHHERDERINRTQVHDTKRMNTISILVDHNMSVNVSVTAIKEDAEKKNCCKR